MMSSTSSLNWEYQNLERDCLNIASQKPITKTFKKYFSLRLNQRFIIEGFEKKLCTLIPRLATISTHCYDSEGNGESRDVSRPSTCKISSKYDGECNKADHLSLPINSTRMCVGQEWNKFRVLYGIVLLTLLVKLVYC